MLDATAGKYLLSRYQVVEGKQGHHMGELMRQEEQSWLPGMWKLFPCLFNTMHMQ